MSITVKDLEDIKKKIEGDDPKVSIEWITSKTEQEEREVSPMITADQIHSEEIIHLDSGSYKHDEAIKAWKQNKLWGYVVMMIRNDNPYSTLQDVRVHLQYEYSAWHQNSFMLELPPKVGEPTEYTVKRSRRFIDKNLKTKEDFDKYKCKYFADQDIHIPKDKRMRHRVSRERINVGNMRPRTVRYIIMKSKGFSNRVTVEGDFDPNKNNKKNNRR